MSQIEMFTQDQYYAQNEVGYCAKGNHVVKATEGRDRVEGFSFRACPHHPDEMLCRIFDATLDVPANARWDTPKPAACCVCGVVIERPDDDNRCTVGGRATFLCDECCRKRDERFGRVGAAGQGGSGLMQGMERRLAQ